MKPFGTINPVTAQAENELVSKILDEIQERKHMTESSRRLPTDMPGDYLVQLAGELSLCASEEAVNIYGLNLWPDIRSMIDSPEDLAFGSYDHARNKTDAVIQGLSAEPEERGFKLAAALSRPKAEIHVDDTLMSVFILRLDAGFFLAGLKTVWPQIASSLIRILYNRCGLSEWDRVLSENRLKLADYSYTLRQILASTPAGLDEDDFKILLDLAKADHRSNLTLVSSGSGIPEDAKTVRPWQVYAVDDFFKQFFPEKMESGNIRVMQDEMNGPIQIFNEDNGFYDVIFSHESQDSVGIALPEKSSKAGDLKGFYLFETVSERIGMDEDDEDLMVIRFIGRLPLEKLTREHLSESPGTLLHIKKSEALPECVL